MPPPLSPTPQDGMRVTSSGKPKTLNATLSLAMQRNTLSCHPTQHSLLPCNATHTHTLSLSCHPTHHVSNGLLNSSASPDYSRVSLTRPAPTQASHNKISSAGTWCVGRRSVRTLWEEESGVGRPGMGAPKACSARCMMCRLHSSASSLYIDR